MGASPPSHALVWGQLCICNTTKGLRTSIMLPVNVVNPWGRVQTTKYTDITLLSVVFCINWRANHKQRNGIADVCQFSYVGFLDHILPPLYFSHALDNLIPWIIKGLGWEGEGEREYETRQLILDGNRANKLRDDLTMIRDVSWPFLTRFGPVKRSSVLLGTPRLQTQCDLWKKTKWKASVLASLFPACWI